jgi:hypothetical protein
MSTSGSQDAGVGQSASEAAGNRGFAAASVAVAQHERHVDEHLDDGVCGAVIGNGRTLRPETPEFEERLRVFNLDHRRLR